MLIGKRLKQRRKELSLSGDEMPRYLGVDRTTYYRYERGAIVKIPGEVLQRAATRLGVTTAWLLGQEETPCSASSLSRPDQELLSLYHQLTQRDRAVVLGEIRGMLLMYTKKNASRITPAGDERI